MIILAVVLVFGGFYLFFPSDFTKEVSYKDTHTFNYLNKLCLCVLSDLRGRKATCIYLILTIESVNS